MEGMVLDFLSQLSRSLPIPPTDGEAKKDTEALADIAIELVDRKRPQSDGPAPTRVVRFPQNKRRGNARGLATLFRVMELSHDGLLSGSSLSKRDVYYNDVALFKSQNIVNSLVDDLAATCGVARSDLNIAAASKGLWCGAGLSLIMAKSGTVIAGQCEEPVLIPAQESIASISVCEEVSWVLVVEKDAVFQTLCRSGLATHPTLPGPGLIITGKGYPDVATRDLVALLSRSTTIPLLALVDCDVHGVDIFSCYKYGSRSMTHEQERLQASRLVWIGVLSSDLARLGVDKDDLLPMSAHDHKKAIALLKSPACAAEPLWRLSISSERLKMY
ncbi:topoisomerase acting in meiosis [Exidia glandulosa HHB12029]|uniref:DNA topoisomerase (ATP-hydrolyzing) n=1 Tax=Exidia glandulosa HHB12029 TaxID=1314781 RepID=A0A165EZK1_EXIGL|nr:topoisomerase acting in meiosis [Exidia glandulosa HHB12029]